MWWSSAHVDVVSRRVRRRVVAHEQFSEAVHKHLQSRFIVGRVVVLVEKVFAVCFNLQELELGSNARPTRIQPHSAIGLGQLSPEGHLSETLLGRHLETALTLHIERIGGERDGRGRLAAIVVSSTAIETGRIA